MKLHLKRKKIKNKRDRREAKSQILEQLKPIERDYFNYDCTPYSICLDCKKAKIDRLDIIIPEHIKEELLYSSSKYLWYAESWITPTGIKYKSFWSHNIEAFIELIILLDTVEYDIESLINYLLYPEEGIRSFARYIINLKGE